MNSLSLYWYPTEFLKCIGMSHLFLLLFMRVIVLRSNYVCQSIINKLKVKMQTLGLLT
uniref:Uncharacterized protein n=1 Tax=Anguilla anguilla TaxID=7936 RepID=A0A0E9WYD6_ANGAN